MTTKHHMMIDLETMGTFVNAPVVTIGACFFDPLTGQVGATFYRKIDMAEAMKFGTVDPETLRWWLKQDPAAQKELTSGNSTLADALRDLSAFYNTGNDAKVWGNGPTFDISILDYAYWKCLGQKAPWPFWNVRDVRTVVNLAEGLVKKPAAFTKGGVAHNALDDCIFQVGYVSKMWQALRGKATTAQEYGDRLAAEALTAEDDML